MPTKNVTVPIGSIELSPETYDKHVKSAGAADPTGALKHRIETYLALAAAGAVVIPPEGVAEIERAMGKPVKNSRDIIQAATKSAGIEDGEWAFRFAIDPEFRAPLEERAREVGRTPKELIQDVVDTSLENNWVYGLTCEGERKTFNPRDLKWFTERLGPDFTVADLRKKFAELEKAAEKVEVAK